ncbi:hypothetical protein [Nonomuraea gerenzanensis]|uniref:Uncharacterized protein n=1 Tax=Nonomuraea gerenzanensis TaxID=93944 RepID=A0A1M4EEI2_9ACTN|nr:hypothetical protein [Nonomuraea gerenzanensis]UBU08832.1 hypothetical protein LCN96_31100 [Nonomuraea gerenzanensis]SBO97194.1 hypothetical protein BN4615_P6710 [Nonomuraea gerenzanensis]
MNSSDARIAAAYTTAPNGTVADDTPNAGPPRSPTFDLVLQLEAGNVLGQSGGDYTLNIVAINENTGLPVASLVPTGNPFKEEFKAPAWTPSGNDFVRSGSSPGVLRYSITVPSGVTGRFHYNVDFVSSGFQVVELARTPSFLLV